MIRLLIVDDHPALRAGLLTVLRNEPGLVPCATASSATEAFEKLRDDPDVVLLDYELPDSDGLAVCRQVKRRPDAPRVLIYSAHADDKLALPARLAGADGMLDKGAAAEVLFEAIRAIAGGAAVFPPPRRDLLETGAEALEPEDLPILGMVLDGTPLGEVGDVLRMDAEELDRRVGAMIDAIRPRLGGD